MKFLLAISFVILASSQAREIGTRSFNGFQVFSVYVDAPEKFEVIKSLYEHGTMDFWTKPKHHGITDIMASPEEAVELLELLNKNGMTYDVKIQNVQELVDVERAQNKKAKGKMNWMSYPRWAVLEAWILSLDSSDVASVSKIGETYEGRNMYAVKISTGGSGKKAVLIDANIHAREFISGATATWILNELTINTAAYSNLLSQMDIYVIPLINVDGYEFAQTIDRMWRKTRSKNSGSSCVGCDPNRNFAFKFGGEDTSSSPCSDIFKGPSAFSELETAAVRDFVLDTEAAGVTFNAYFTMHSYGHYWLLPWGYTEGVYPPDYPEQLDVGTRAVAALKGVHNTVYTVGQGADQLYGVGGASDDWAKDHGIKYTATIEMRDTGQYGFFLPPFQIIPNAEEVWEAIKVYFDQIISEQETF